MKSGDTETRATTMPSGGTRCEVESDEVDRELVGTLADLGVVRANARHLLRLDDDVGLR